MNFGYILHYDERQEVIADVTLSNHTEYCELHHYKLINDKTIWQGNRNGMWMKWYAIMRAIEDSSNKDLDWFFWSDIDVLIMDQQRSLDTVISNIDYKRYNIIASKLITYDKHIFKNLQADVIEPYTTPTHDNNWFTFHTGNFFIKNSIKTLEMIKTIVNDKRFFQQPELFNHMTGDEIGFTIYYFGYPEYRKRMGLLPNSLLHTSTPKYCTVPGIKIYDEKDFLIHAFFLSVEKKVEMLTHFKDLAIK